MKNFSKIRVLHIVGSKNGKVNASIKAQILSLGEKINVIPFEYSAGSIVGYWKAYRELKIKLREGKIDIVHAHHSRSGYLATLAIAYDVPLVVSFMGTDLYSMGFVNRLSYRSVIRHAKALIVKSERMREIIRGCQYVHVVPNGVDMSLFKPIDQLVCREKLGFVNDQSYILFAADPLRAEKNYFLAQSAIKALKYNYGFNNVSLVPVYGVQQEILVDYMNACDCLILTSRYEGSPNVIKEAMACNTPIVSTDVGDVQNIIGKTEGCRVVSHNSKSISDALFEVLSLKRRTNGRDSIDYLSSEKVMRTIISIYDSII